MQELLMSNILMYDKILDLEYRNEMLLLENIDLKKNKTVGRKHSIPYEVCYPYIVDYIHGRIGKKEFKAKCGYSEKYKLDKCGYIERYKRDNNIKSFKNTIDVILANGKLEEDKYVGYIQFNDGKRQELYYH